MLFGYAGDPESQDYGLMIALAEWQVSVVLLTLLAIRMAGYRLVRNMPRADDNETVILNG